MARPIVMTVGMFAFLTAWNDFMVPLLCTITSQYATSGGCRV